MKKLICLFLVLSLILSVSGCTSQKNIGDDSTNGPNDLWENASVNTSALAYYIYDGDQTTRQFMFDANQRIDLLQKLSDVTATPVSDWSPSRIKLPVYGISITGKDGHPLEAAWSDGHLITDDGNVYKFNFDFSSISETYTLDSADAWDTAIILPSAEHLFKHENVWHKMLMSEAEEITLADGISFTITKVSGNTLTVQMINHTDHELTYGDSFSVQVKLDEYWYDIPAVSGTNWAFSAIAYLLPPSGKTTKSYSLEMYGTLPDGNYRILTDLGRNTLTAEFSIKDGALSIK